MQWLVLGGFLSLVVGVGALIGTVTAPGEWYTGLDKPPFNPPNWLFGPVWFALYVAIAIAGWRIWRVAPEGTAMKVWVGQMLLNWLWSPVFFTAHLLWPAVLVILALVVAIIAFMKLAWNTDRIAAWLFAPYLGWVGFATLLNVSIAILN